MDFLHAIILGIVEGITEFLPVSSTGHLILTSKILGIPSSNFLTTFEITIQLGAILAIVCLYFRKLFLDRAIMERLFVALLPALGVGFLFYASIRNLFASEVTVVVALFLGGVAILLFEWKRKGIDGTWSDIATLPYRTAFFIGLFQALSVIPGVSRAGATILGGLLLGMKRTAIVEFSFLLAVPTMIAATTLDLAKHAALFSLGEAHVLAVGFLTSFLVALGVVQFFLRFIESHSFIAFGIYRMIAAGVFFIFFLLP